MELNVFFLIWFIWRHFMLAPSSALIGFMFCYCAQSYRLMRTQIAAMEKLFPCIMADGRKKEDIIHCMANKIDEKSTFEWPDWTQQCCANSHRTTTFECQKRSTKMIFIKFQLEIGSCSIDFMGFLPLSLAQFFSLAVCVSKFDCMPKNFH